MQVEICIETLEEAKLAAKYGCNRIEVCSALDLGGLTPSIGLINSCLELNSIESHILIRPRAGNFVYSSSEIEIMKADIQIAAKAGAKGVVFACLNIDNEIDIIANNLLIQTAGEHQLKITFHRAIDFTKNYFKSFEIITELGFDRVLTSGREVTAFEGLENIKTLISKNNTSIEIMAGSGINAENVHLFRDIGLNAIHFSIRKQDFISNNVSMGNQFSPDENKIKQIIQIIN